jgi:two-component system chemotaxis response regulator CheY
MPVRWSFSKAWLPPAENTNACPAFSNDSTNQFKPESDMHSILAVDDSASMRQMVSFTLKSAGYNVIEAVDGQDAYEKAGGRSFDLVLTDQNMPRMDGISLTKKLRESPQFKSTPILILTTESSDQMKQAGRAAGATGWLVKPFDPNKLIEVIQKVIR